MLEKLQFSLKDLKISNLKNENKTLKHMIKTKNDQETENLKILKYLLEKENLKNKKINEKKESLSLLKENLENLKNLKKEFKTILQKKEMLRNKISGNISDLIDYLKDFVNIAEINQNDSLLKKRFETKQNKLASKSCKFEYFETKE